MEKLLSDFINLHKSELPKVIMKMVTEKVLLVILL